MAMRFMPCCSELATQKNLESDAWSGNNVRPQYAICDKPTSWGTYYLHIYTGISGLHSHKRFRSDESSHPYQVDVCSPYFMTCEFEVSRQLVGPGHQYYRAMGLYNWKASLKFENLKSNVNHIFSQDFSYMDFLSIRNLW